MERGAALHQRIDPCVCVPPRRTLSASPNGALSFLGAESDQLAANNLTAQPFFAEGVLHAKCRCNEAAERFTAAISSDQNDVTLDPSIAGLLDEISGADFLEQFSIYSRGHLRKMGDFLSHIGNIQLKEDPARVACAVDEILKLFDRLEITVKQTVASEKRIEAARSS